MKVKQKPIILNAVLWTGENEEEIEELMIPYCEIDDLGYLTIDCNQGYIPVEAGNYIVINADGTYSVLSKEAFENCYEIVK